MLFANVVGVIAVVVVVVAAAVGVVVAIAIGSSGLVWLELRLELGLCV